MPYPYHTTLVPFGETRAAMAQMSLRLAGWDPDASPLLSVLCPTVGLAEKEVLTYTVFGTSLSDAVSMVRYAKQLGIDPLSPTFALVSRATLMNTLGRQLTMVLGEATAGNAQQRNVLQVMREGEHPGLRDLRLQQFTLRAMGKPTTITETALSVMSPPQVAHILTTAPKVYALHSSKLMTGDSVQRWLLDHRDCGETFREAGLPLHNERRETWLDPRNR